MQKTAMISECGKFRYRLGRRWDDGPTLLFVMLNPSTADADQDDATIRRCIGFATREGFAAIEVVNLFAYRATDPRNLKLAGYPVGPDNDHYIAEAVLRAAKVCVAWGVNVEGLERPQMVLPMLRRLEADLYCLKITKSGHPSHPLMLASTCRLMPFTLDAIAEGMDKEKGGAA